jgi:phage/plasmid-like protein (TIGR03299 family)
VSKESPKWLHENVLRGMTDKFGVAWWLEEKWDPTPSCHYEGAIPFEDVQVRLFNWQPVKIEVVGVLPAEFAAGVGEVLVDEAFNPVRIVRSEQKRIWVVRSDNGRDLGAFKDGYEPHGYQQWLINNVQAIAQGAVYISSAGQLDGGAVAWCQFETDELTHRSGIRVRPHLLATTSLNGSLATCYLENSTFVECDNTHAAALREGSPVYKTFHSKHSKFDDEAARQALGILTRSAEEWELELDLLTGLPVSDREWATFLEDLVPLPEEKGRSKTLAEKKRHELNELWRHDTRVAPWAGTAEGVVLAVNTWETHFKTVSGTTRAERQMTRAVKGEWEKVDRDTLGRLDAIKGGQIGDLRVKLMTELEARHLVDA